MSLSSTPPYELVKAATHELLAGKPDWSANMQIVDLCNQHPEL